MQNEVEKDSKYAQYPRIGIDQMLNNVKKVLISGMGGGGDVLTALHVRWALEKCAPHVEWVQGGITGGPIAHFKEIKQLGDVSAWVNQESKSKPPHRLIEAIIAKRLDEQVLLLSCTDGVQRMVKNLNDLIKTEKIEMMIFIDGGTDSLAYLGSSVASPAEDTMTLAAAGLGEYGEPLKYRVSGVSVVGSDAEMSLNEISQQLLKISRAGGYVGGAFFPVERLGEYAEILSEILRVYPTATAQAPLLVTSYPFGGRAESPYSQFSNGFQLATFLFDAEVAAEVGNDFTHLILEVPNRTGVKHTIFTLLEEYRAKKHQKKEA